jgi:hypothetical protein
MRRLRRALDIEDLGLALPGEDSDRAMTVCRLCGVQVERARLSNLCGATALMFWEGDPEAEWVAVYEGWHAADRDRVIAAADALRAAKDEASEAAPDRDDPGWAAWWERWEHPARVAWWALVEELRAEGPPLCSASSGGHDPVALHYCGTCALWRWPGEHACERADLRALRERTVGGLLSMESATGRRWSRVEGRSTGGIGLARLSRIERGKVTPTVAEVELIAEALRIEPDDLRARLPV